MEKRQIKIAIQIANIVSFISVIIVNMLANILPLNNKNTGELSDAYPNLFVPAGLTFSIWLIIYILLALFSSYQAKDLLKSEKEDLLFFDKISIFFLLSNLANIAWIFAWHWQIVSLSLLIMLGFLIILIIIYLRLDIGKSEVSKGERRFIHLPISVYLGWITIATIANTTALLVFVGWDRFGLTEEFWTILVIIVAVIINMLMLRMRKDIAFSLVSAWVFLGIVIKQISLNPLIGFTSLTAMIIVGVLVIYILYKKMQ